MQFLVKRERMVRKIGLVLAGALTIGLPVALLSQHTGSGLLESEAGRPWPAPVTRDASIGQTPLAPADAIRTFTMPPGFRIQLVASEPLVKDPILAEFDEDGRLWVLELHGFAVNRQMENSFEPINELVVLDDTDGDGAFDSRTVFMDDLVMPRAFKVLANGCALVGEPPNLWHACDTDGDLQADTRELVSDRFATRGVVEHGANGLMWAMDNTIVVAQNDWDLRFIDGKPTVVPSLNRGQWGLTQDDAGRVYRVFNTDPLYVDYLKPAYYARNPNMVRTRGLYDLIVDAEKSRIWPARPTFGVNRGYRTENYREDGSQRYYGGVSSPMIYRGTSLPEKFRGQPFVVDGPTNLVHLLRFEVDASGRRSAADFYPQGEFLASTDERFRPISLTPGWDGTFYVVDMYRGVSQDGPLQTDYLRNYILERNLWQGINYGRIYRVVYDGMPTDPRPRMSSLGSADLVGYLSHPNGWWRDKAQQLLVLRRDRSVLPALERLVRDAPDPRTRLHALWTIDGIAGAGADLVDRALGDADPAVRAAAVRLAEPRLREGDKATLARVQHLARDPSIEVRWQVAASLGELPAAQRLDPLLALLLEQGADDPVMVDAIVSGLAGLERRMLGKVLEGAQPARFGDAIEMLAGAIARGRAADDVADLLRMAGDGTTAEGVHRALLAGLQAGLRGPPRLGPPQPGSPQPQLLRLASRPGSVIAAAEAGGPLAEAAEGVLAQLDWPGKPAASQAASLPPEAKRLFDAGRDIYANMCAGCHSDEGRGAAIARDLAGSRFVTGRPEILARILLSGKEGQIGLMPPAGSSLSDDELAAVMTFIRASWGNSAPPVQPDMAREWRAAYAHRKVPWTDEELEP